MTIATLSAQGRARANHLNLALWTFQGWLAMFFIAAGYAKLTESMANLTILMQWPAVASPAFVRGLGVVEITLALMVLAPLISWRLGRAILLVGSLGLIALQTIMLVLHTLDLNTGLALTNIFLLTITVPVFWFRRNPDLPRP